MITLILITCFIVLVIGIFWPVKSKNTYTYVKDKDEDGNIVEKVVDNREQDK
jgi:hypothetical protein